MSPPPALPARPDAGRVASGAGRCSTRLPGLVEFPSTGLPGAELASFDWGPVHFVALDTERVGAEQAEWLDRDLEQNTLPWSVAYMHRPPYSSGKHGGSESVREAFSPLFEKHGVPLVLAGHDHDYERTRVIAGVTYVVTGGGGYGVRPVGSSDFTVRSLSIFHFVRVEVNPQRLLLEAIDTDGAVFDSVEISKPAVP